MLKVLNINKSWNSKIKMKNINNLFSDMKNNHELKKTNGKVSNQQFKKKQRTWKRKKYKFNKNYNNQMNSTKPYKVKT